MKEVLDATSVKLKQFGPDFWRKGRGLQGDA